MAIVKADILTRVNNRLQTNFSGTQLDTMIQETLDDLSEEDLLIDTDTEQTLESGDTTLDEPTGFRALSPGGIILTITSSSSRQAPLIKLPRGHKQYNELKHNDNTTGIPRWFSNFNKLFFLWQPANQDFTSLIEYYKNHPALSGETGSIEFDDNFKNVIYAGVTFKVALEFGRIKAISIWGPVYADAKQKRIDSMPRQPRFVNG